MTLINFEQFYMEALKLNKCQFWSFKNENIIQFQIFQIEHLKSRRLKTCNNFQFKCLELLNIKLEAFYIVPLKI